VRQVNPMIYFAVKEEFGKYEENKNG